MDIFSVNFDMIKCSIDRTFDDFLYNNFNNNIKYKIFSYKAIPAHGTSLKAYKQELDTLGWLTVQSLNTICTKSNSINYEVDLDNNAVNIYSEPPHSGYLLNENDIKIWNSDDGRWEYSQKLITDKIIDILDKCITGFNTID